MPALMSPYAFVVGRVGFAELADLARRQAGRKEAIDATDADVVVDER
jgi:hypothetical protein